MSSMASMASSDFGSALDDLSDLEKIVKQIDENENRNRVLDDMSEKRLINKIEIRSKKLINESKARFESIERVFDFSIDCDQNYETSKPLPKLVLPETRFALNVDLEIGFEECIENQKLIVDYCEYRDKKWIYFLKAIKQNDLIRRYEPQFVSFGGPVADIMATVYDTSIDWKMSAQKTNGVIYFFKRRNERNFFSDSNRMNRRSYSGLNFLNFITDREDNLKNEFEKHFAINCVQLDSHKLLTLNEVDAIDQNGTPIDAKLVQMMSSAKDNQFFQKTKLLRFWSKASVQGIDRLVIGNIQKSNNFLIDIEERKVADIPDQCSGYWSDLKCIEFLNRLLAFMKKSITEENIVFEFTFRRGEEDVICHRLHPNHSNHSKQFLPQFYTQFD